MLKPRGMKCVEHVARKGYIRNGRKIWKEETCKKKSTWMRDDIETDFKESTWEFVGYIHMP
jgi:hypothetical protein